MSIGELGEYPWVFERICEIAYSPQLRAMWWIVFVWTRRNIIFLHTVIGSVYAGPWVCTQVPECVQQRTVNGGRLFTHWWCRWCSLQMVQRSDSTACRWCSIHMLLRADGTACRWCSMQMVQRADGAACRWCSVQMVVNELRGGSGLYAGGGEGIVRASATTIKPLLPTSRRQWTSCNS